MPIFLGNIFLPRRAKLLPKLSHPKPKDMPAGST